MPTIAKKKILDDSGSVIKVNDYVIVTAWGDGANQSEVTCYGKVLATSGKTRVRVALNGNNVGLDIKRIAPGSLRVVPVEKMADIEVRSIERSMHFGLQN